MRRRKRTKEGDSEGDRRERKNIKKGDRQGDEAMKS